MNLKYSLFLFLLLSSLLFAQSTGKITGTVVDPSGAVIPGASIVLRSADGAVQRTLHVDPNGAFSFAGLAAGGYRLTAAKTGFEAREFSVMIAADATPAPLRIALSVGSVSTTVEVQGRADDLVGIATSATQGTVGPKEIEERPMLRSGEVLEAVPGVMITQHAGGGKANQYYLRGFNLDHGTDIAIFLDGMPLNLPSHAHGEGYSDMNTVIPEFVKGVEYEKGPYYAEVGNFSSAAAAHLEFFKTLPHNFLQVEGGKNGYGRTVFGVSRKLGKGTLLYGGEAYHDNGPWTTHADNFFKYNGLLTYSQGEDGKGFSVTARAYRGTWNSSDQIPVDAQPLVGYFGTLNPTDGGHSQRYSLQGEWHRRGASSATRVTAYGFYYDMNLFSDFTYYLIDPVKGDQFNQQDRRWVAGFDARHTLYGQLFGRRSETTVGMQLRNDWVHNGLFRSQNRVRTDKTDVNACHDEYVDECATNPNLTATLPAATSLNKFTATIGSAYVENKIQWTSKFRTVVALRGDDAKYVVTNLTPTYTSPIFGTVNFRQANSGSASKFLPSPKATLIFGPWARTEIYAQGGFAFHSNDARGATQKEEPISPDNPFPTAATPITPLVQTKGGEIGIRTSAVPHLQSTVSLWYLRSNSELMQSGDTGGTSASDQSSNRYGVEWANYYTPVEHVSFDFDIADSRAQFTQVDPDDAAFLNPTVANGLSYPRQLPGGKLVPEAVRLVLSAGATLHEYRGLQASLRLRYFGPRELTSDGINRSSATTLVNAGLGYRFNSKWSLSTELLNLLNRKADDITYAYVSRITPTASAEFTNVSHPTEPFQVRFALRYTFGAGK
ncbi:MAG: TonB-dependent receptor [Acidobacteriota bacterium]|nr:TonB-dependent receptor [Acidobacteriota bacterium]